jgi:hypothetical protein
LSVDDRHSERGQFQRSPTGPWVNPQRPPTGRPASRPRYPRSRRPLWSVILFVVVAASIGVRAFRDVSRPEAWDYWKELYVSPSLTSSLLANADLNRAARGRPALVITGKIGVASASWFRARLDETHLAAGDTVLISSPGGDVDQAIIMGETIRARGLATAVGIVDASGRIKPSFCASACVLVYAGGQPRLGVEGSALGVHRFVSTGTMSDPVAETQRTTGMILSYLTRMGVSPLLVEAMSQTSDIRWLGPREMTAMNLVTAPSRAP